MHLHAMAWSLYNTMHHCKATPFFSDILCLDLVFITFGSNEFAASFIIPSLCHDVQIFVPLSLYYIFQEFL